MWLPDVTNLRNAFPNESDHAKIIPEMLGHIS
jgi:hypothetical protein